MKTTSGRIALDVVPRASRSRTPRRLAMPSCSSAGSVGSISPVGSEGARLLRQGQRERESNRGGRAGGRRECVRREARGQEHTTAAIGCHDHRFGRNKRPAQPLDYCSQSVLDAGSTVTSIPNNGPERCTWRCMAAKSIGSPAARFLRGVNCAASKEGGETGAERSISRGCTRELSPLPSRNPELADDLPDDGHVWSSFITRQHGLYRKTVPTNLPRG